jgi:ABC-type cobalamin/Fe3+-siderophores transport system ATPase subunit
LSAERLKLVNVRIFDFRCFADTGDVPIDSHVTTLIAENENGKTSLLEAMAWTLSDADLETDEVRTGGAGIASVLLDFEVPPSTRAALKQDGLDMPKVVRIRKSSDGSREVLDARTQDALEIDETVPERRHKELTDDLVTLLTSVAIAEGYASVRDEAVEKVRATTWNDMETREVARTWIVDEVLPGLDEAHAAEVTAAADTFIAAIQQPSVFDALRPRLPDIVYFDDRVDHLRDIAAYDQVAASPDDYRTMVNLAKLASVDLLAVGSRSPHDKQTVSDLGSQTVTEDARGFWRGEISMRITFSETQMVVNVEHLGRRQPPSRRSRGLQWFLGFFVNFRAETKDQLRNAILLLDEPGLHLHLKQQGHLLRFFDVISSTNQVIYSTHLPSMIAPNKLGRIRILEEDPDNEGATLVRPKIQAVRSMLDVMRPIRAALGMGIAQSVSLGERTLVVEGPTDVMICDAMNACCTQADRSHLSDDVTLFATVGVGKKMIPFVTLLANEGSAGAVLVDDDAAGHAALKEIEKQFGDLVPVIRTKDGASSPSGMEIEDLLSRAYLVDLVNAAHRDRVPKWKDIGVADLDSAKPINDELERLFAARRYGDYRKIHAARELQARALAGETPPDKVSLDQFENLFERVTTALDTVKLSE